MKVLQINTFCGKESTGRIALDLYRGLEESGHDSCIAYGRENIVKDIQTIRIGSKKDFYIHGIISRFTDRQGFYSRSATEKFIEEIEQYNPDVIHLHNLHGYYLNLPILFNYLAICKKKIIWTLHDCWAFTGHCAHFEFIGCEKWKKGCYDCPQKNMYPKSLWKDSSKKNYEDKKNMFAKLKNMTIVTPSKWLKNLVSQSILEKYPLEVIPNGVDLNVFKPTNGNFREKYGLVDKYIILGVASVWTSRKGLDDFIKLSEIIDHGKQKIVLVGLSKKQMRMLPESILGIERTENLRELAEIYTTSDCFFNPTYEDTYPTTNLEALACGTKVISYDTGGSPEVISKLMGRVIKKGDYREICLLVNEENINCQIEMSSIDKKRMIAKYMILYNRKVADKG